MLEAVREGVVDEEGEVENDKAVNEEDNEEDEGGKDTGEDEVCDKDVDKKNKLWLDKKK